MRGQGWTRELSGILVPETYLTSEGQIPSSVYVFSSFGNRAVISVVHPCESPHGTELRVQHHRASAEQPESFVWLCLFLAPLHTYPSPWCICTNTGLHKPTAKLHSELHENEKVCLLWRSDTGCLLSQTSNLAEHLASRIEQPRCGYRRDSLSCTLHYRVPGYRRDLLIRELSLK